MEIMEYNRTKRGVELGAAITAFAYCILDLILEVLTLSRMIMWGGYGDANFWIFFFLGVGLVVVELIFSIKLILKPVFINNTFKNKNSSRIGLIVISSILAVLMIILGAGLGVSNITSMLGFIIFLIVIVLESIALSMSDYSCKENVYKENAFINYGSSLESKIAQLKHLKELGVIDEEQYKNAVEKNIKELL